MRLLATRNGFLSLLSLVLILASVDGYAQSEKLQTVHQWIEEEYPAVDHINADEFLAGKSSLENVVVFDVREPEEHEVSHLDGAIQVDPEISEEAFMAQFGDVLRGKEVVFYCSVGRRSSLLADKVSDSLIEGGADDIYNLKHGIFGWHDDRLPLVNQNAATDYVHPFSWRWKRYLKRKEFARYDPAE